LFGAFWGNWAALPGGRRSWRSAGRSGCEITRFWVEKRLFSVLKLYVVAISDRKRQQSAAGSTSSTEKTNFSTEKRYRSRITAPEPARQLHRRIKSALAPHQGRTTEAVRPIGAVLGPCWDPYRARIRTALRPHPWRRLARAVAGSPRGLARRSPGRSGCEITRFWVEKRVFSVLKLYVVAISDQKIQQIAAGSTSSAEKTNFSTEKPGQGGIGAP
jgi:hypothetical protein